MIKHLKSRQHRNLIFLTLVINFLFTSMAFSETQDIKLLAYNNIEQNREAFFSSWQSLSTTYQNTELLSRQKFRFLKNNNVNYYKSMTSTTDDNSEILCVSAIGHFDKSNASVEEDTATLFLTQNTKTSRGESYQITRELKKIEAQNNPWALQALHFFQDDPRFKNFNTTTGLLNVYTAYKVDIISQYLINFCEFSNPSQDHVIDTSQLVKALRDFEIELGYSLTFLHQD